MAWFPGFVPGLVLFLTDIYCSFFLKLVFLLTLPNRFL